MVPRSRENEAELASAEHPELGRPQQAEPLGSLAGRAPEFSGQQRWSLPLPDGQMLHMARAVLAAEGMLMAEGC